MRLKQFIKSLPKDNWRKVKDSHESREHAKGTLRRFDCCPLTCLENKIVSEWQLCGTKLGLPDYICEFIVLASDGIHPFFKLQPSVEFEKTHSSNIIELRKILERELLGSV